MAGLATGLYEIRYDVLIRRLGFQLPQQQQMLTSRKCCGKTSDCDFNLVLKPNRFLRQFSKPSAPRPATKSGNAAIGSKHPVEKSQGSRYRDISTGRTYPDRRVRFTLKWTFQIELVVAPKRLDPLFLEGSSSSRVICSTRPHCAGSLLSRFSNLVSILVPVIV